MMQPTAHQGQRPLSSTKHLYQRFPPDHYGDSGHGVASLNGLYQPPIFTPANHKNLPSYQQPSVPSPAGTSSLNSHRRTKSYPNKSQAAKDEPILIRPLKVEHSPSILYLIASLHPTLRRIVESWSGDTGASQLKVLNKMIADLEPDTQAMLKDIIDGRIALGIDPVRRLLEPLCGPTGKLCSVVRNGNQSGVSSISCNICQVSFSSNAVQAFAHHLITGHWGIKAFRCYAVGCHKHFAWTQDRDRHEKTKHNAYRRKAYDSAIKPEPTMSQDMPSILLPADPVQVYHAFKGYNVLKDMWDE